MAALFYENNDDNQDRNKNYDGGGFEVVVVIRLWNRRVYFVDESATRNLDGWAFCWMCDFNFKGRNPIKFEGGLAQLVVEAVVPCDESQCRGDQFAVGQMSKEAVDSNCCYRKLCSGSHLG